MKSLVRVSGAAGKTEQTRLYGKRARDLQKRGPRALNVIDRHPRGR